MDDLIHSVSFSMRGFLPLTRTESITHMHGLIVYMNEGLPFAQDLSQGIFIYVFNWFYFILCLTSFSSISHLVFGDFNVHHKNRLNCSGGADRPGELCYKMTLISNELIPMVNFSTRITDSNSHSPDLLDLFIFSDAIICSTSAFSP